MNFGCGPHWATQPDWVHLDREDFGQRYMVDVGVEPTPFDDKEFDYTVAHHSLQMVPYHHLHTVLVELRRISRGVRVSVPDIAAAVAAWERQDKSWFPVADRDEATVDGKFCAYLTWFSTQAQLFTASTLETWLRRAGFEGVLRSGYGETRFDVSACELDNRPYESLWLEAWG